MPSILTYLEKLDELLTVLEVIVEYKNSYSGIAVILTSPSGVDHSHTCEDDRTMKITKCVVPGRAEVSRKLIKVTFHVRLILDHIISSSALTCMGPVLSVAWGCRVYLYYQ